jgi:hypothetical protein
MSPALPRIIALCGHPTCGKTTAGELISSYYGHTIADDGRPLRLIAVNYFGLTHNQVFTQEGKLEKVMLNGREWTVREILGEIGNAFEEKFGGDIIPIMSHNSRSRDEYVVYGSVRREQGLYWRNQGALVLEIVNPLVGPSQYEFDTYNAAYAHARVLNDGLARGLAPEEARADLLAKLRVEIEAFASQRLAA